MAIEKKVNIIKITKGYGEKIGSTESYSSFDFQPSTIEVEVNIDITTAEGLESLKKINSNLFKLVCKMHDDDVMYAQNKYPELAATLKKKESMGLR